MPSSSATSTPSQNARVGWASKGCEERARLLDPDGVALHIPDREFEGPAEMEAEGDDLLDDHRTVDGDRQPAPHLVEREVDDMLLVLADGERKRVRRHDFPRATPHGPSGRIAAQGDEQEDRPRDEDERDQQQQPRTPGTVTVGVEEVPPA
ncbi:hypothetical protein [Leifsonia sp. 1010]|uniref:hypothetical protein n=1 Tax=Leifsonia sp. 1010 TaxID=2817769 RepID=UPI00285AD5D9|nr:hypothetical protein [Leifsonia sp. 1010]MDR6612260.1 hypothetical protein [Leifsonia sp. 1010]